MLPGTELVPGGYITSACRPLIYTANAVPERVLWEQLCLRPGQQPDSSGDPEGKRRLPSRRSRVSDREFFTSTDNWFRPVHLSTGPDGAIYVLDFYREVIETPLSLPDDIKKQLNLESRGRGRIWRIVPKDFKPSSMPDFSKLTPAQLADELASANPWRRLTAQRLLVEGKPKDAVARIHELLPKTTGKPGRVNLLWTLHGLGELQPQDIESGLEDPEPGIRENALRLAEPYLGGEHRRFIRDVLTLANDEPSPRVRFQLALSAGALPPQWSGPALSMILSKDTDPWTETAALSSSASCGPDLLGLLSKGENPNLTRMSRVAAIIGSKGDQQQIIDVLDRAEETGHSMADRHPRWAGAGMRNSKAPLSAWFAKPPVGAEKAMVALRERFEKTASAIRDETAKSETRVAAAALLAYAPFDLAGPALADALAPSVPGDVQSAAVRGLATHTDSKVAELFLRNWKTYGPSVRALILDAMRKSRCILASRPWRKKQLSPQISRQHRFNS